ncbi:MAG: hypothetical protein MMC33_004698 [Icmadophila ericetorum]|nr:hypothetical protein [Icmadophila ericetorum]
MDNIKDGVEDGMANSEINKLAGDVGVPSGMDGMVDKEADNFINGQGSTGESSGMGQTAGDGMLNEEVDKVAGDFGAGNVSDGMINQEVDQEANKFL